jgi:hypothetical protein
MSIYAKSILSAFAATVLSVNSAVAATYVTFDVPGARYYTVATSINAAGTVTGHCYSQTVTVP